MGLYANIHAKRKRGEKMRKKVPKVHQLQNNLRELRRLLEKNREEDTQKS